MQLREQARGVGAAVRANGDGGAAPTPEAAAGGHSLFGLVKLNTSKLEQKIRLRKVRRAGLPLGKDRRGAVSGLRKAFPPILSQFR